MSDGIGLGTSECSKGRALSVGAKTDAPAADAHLVAVELTDSSEINGGDADTAPDDFANVFVSTEPDGTKKLTVTLMLRSVSLSPEMLALARSAMKALSEGEFERLKAMCDPEVELELVLRRAWRGGGLPRTRRDASVRR